MKKIEILEKFIGKVYVKKCLGGTPLKYLCVCPCGDTFISDSQSIRSQKIDCGCGIVSGVHNKPFSTGDIYQGCKILNVSKKYMDQTCYTFLCKCGEKAERTHAEFIKRPACAKCVKKQNREARDRKIADEVIGKEVNGIEVLRLSGRDEKSRLYVDVVCPRCGKEFTTMLSNVKKGIGSCKDCRKGNLEEGHKIARDAWVDGTSILAIMPDRALNKNSTTGYKGVNRRKDGKYRAYIYFKRKQYHLGVYDKMEQAIEARRIAEEKIFGDFLEWYAEKFPERWDRVRKD